ncbi:POU domain, class 6, transcription factor 1 [Emydura macquarii macquarii]|uniref:POU domain, class 6, transcription factor 1 n=1 Tax=Emydura macquarii macquarii TaxID=1129001 RepID=UPI00352A9383
MDTEAVRPQEASLTVNEQGPGPLRSHLRFAVCFQVIVMSSHETIRVLEVGVDAPLPAEDDGKALETTVGEVASSCPVETSEPGREDVQRNLEPVCGETTGEVKSLPGIAPTSVSSVTFNQATSQQQTQTIAPLAVQTAPQVLTQENLATVVTGVMVPAGAVTQPLLIPISIAGQVAGQQGLAVWTFPAATVAALPGLTAASPTGGIYKPPIANLQAAAVLNTAIPAPVQPAQPLQAQPAVQPRPSIQTQAVFQPQVSLQSPPAILPQPAAPPPSVAKLMETQTQITVQPAGFAFNPGIISAASLGGQTQLLSSLAAAPVIANTLPSVQGITSQILTNAQGQVIGTLPWVVNPAGITTANPTPAALPAQNLQVQAVTPQLLLNAQGQVIATLASSAIQTAAIRKPGAPESPAKNEVQPIQPAPALSQPAVVIANPAPAAKPSSAPVPITCSETPTVSQLVSKPQTPNTGSEEDGINLEEIREFAKNFKIRRLSLGLTQTQVGQALTATEGPAYSQSAICRFEKLDITPKSAQKLKPVLEKWLSEAELRNQEGQQNLMEFVGGEPSKKRKRRTSFTPQAIEALNAYFEKNALPTGQEITEIAKELNYDREVVRVWFCNRRQTLKNTSKLNVFQIP